MTKILTALSLTLALSLTACGGPVQQTARPQDRTVATFVSAMRLASKQPDSVIADSTKRIVLTRIAKDSAYLMLGSWIPQSTVNYVGDGVLTASDQGLEFAFTFTALDLTGRDTTSVNVPIAPLQALQILIKNTSGPSAVIDWNAVTLIAKGGKAYQVTHRGVKYSDRTAPMSATTIPPASTLEDFVFPKEEITYESGRYGGWSGRQFFETMRSGDTFALFLPVKRGQETVEYQFRFEVIAPPGVAAARPEATSARPGAAIIRGDDEN